MDILSAGEQRGAAGDHDRRPMRTLTADRLTIPRGGLLLAGEISHAPILTADLDRVKLAATPERAIREPSSGGYRPVQACLFASPRANPSHPTVRSVVPVFGNALSQARHRERRAGDMITEHFEHVDPRPFHLQLRSDEGTRMGQQPGLCRHLPRVQRRDLASRTELGIIHGPA